VDGVDDYVDVLAGVRLFCGDSVFVTVRRTFAPFTRPC
jgi:hypothetical protein